MKALRRQQEMLGKMNDYGSSAKKLTHTTYMPAQFEFTTTNSDAFKDFKVIPVVDRAIKYAPSREPVV